MSCEIKKFAGISDLKQVQEDFGFSQEENWLNAVYYSLSPTGEVLAFAHGSKIIVLSNRWENEKQQYKYSITWSGALENPNEIITSIICLPVVGLSGSGSQSSAEWTCIAIGLSSGTIQFYCDSGFELYAQQWHNEPVQSIKGQSGKKINEELHIAYGTCVCIIQGQHLFQTLRMIKHQMQKGKAGSSDIIPQETIPCRKWSYGGKNVTINDTSVVGAQKTSTFDHLLTASMEGGFHAKYRNAPPQNSLVLGAGVKPYLGFHYAKEGYVQPVLADVARAVATKIKSALPTWLMGSSQDPAVETPPPIVPAEPMVLRFGLCDLQRVSLNVYLAPGNKLAAVSDNLGRIILVDCVRGIALRVWKGYRDAQCSFIRVAEKLAKNSEKINRRYALFLVIYAPRRSCLEIWGLQRGGKIAAFSVSKNGQLVSNTHTVMGVTNSSKTKYSSTTTCMFLDPNDMSLKEITVPFHCAITDANSKTVKDLHLLRRIKLCLRTGDGNDDSNLEEILESARGLQTDEIRLQCVEMLVKTHKVRPKLLKGVLNVFTECIAGRSSESDNEGTDENAEDCDFTHLLQRQQLTSLVLNYTNLLEFYLYIKSEDPIIPPEPKDVEHSENDSKENLSENENDIESDPDEGDNKLISEAIASEFESIQKLIDLSELERSVQNMPRVRFQEKLKSNHLTEYLSIFNCISEEGVILKDELKSNFASVGFQIFGEFLEKGRSLDRFLIEAEKTRLSNRNFMRLLMQYWLEKPFLYKTSDELNSHLRNFTLILQQICALASEKVKYNYNSLSSWWQEIRELLLESPSALKALLAAMMCRIISSRYRQRENSNDGNSSSNEDDHWEQVSQEAAQWTLLIGKLDDIAILSAVLSCVKTANSDSTAKGLTILSYSKPDVSLMAVVNGGKGIVTELVAKWVAASGIDPTLLLEKVPNEDPSEETPAIEPNSFFHYFNMLRDHFPFSMNSGVLLGQLAWEYMCAWSKHMSNFGYFTSALSCLAAIKPADLSIKHGLCCMIWNAHLKIPLEATKKLINKSGKLPKEKCCLQEIGISDVLVAELLEHCSTFLDYFSRSVQHDKVNLRFEELLQEGPVPLCLLSVQQNYGNSELLKLHQQLNQVMFIIASLNIAYSKPIQGLFDGMAYQSFFCEINRQLPYTLPKADLILEKKRLKFLCQGITTTMDLIREDYEQIFLDDHKLWMERIGDLANEWELDINELKKHQVVELYAHGWDDYAETQLEGVLDTQAVGSLLLKITGLRLNLYMTNKPIVYAQVASFGPLISSFLDTLLESETRLPNNQSPSDISLDRLKNLAGKTFKCLADKENRELRIAGQLFDACATLSEDEMDLK